MGYTVSYSVNGEGENLFMTIKETLISAIVKTLEWIVKDLSWGANVLMYDEQINEES